MAGGFTITISAVDKASRVMNGITKRINGMNAPARRFRASFGRFMDAAGVTRVAGAFRDWGRSGLAAAASLTRVIEPMGILTGAASIAGLYKLTTAWAQFGSQLGFDAKRIGIMPDKLQALQGAAEMAGSSAGAMTAGLRGLHDNMVNALGGRNNEALLYFRQLGINIGSIRGGARNVTAVLPELADKIAALKDPTLQARVATATLGGAAEDLLPFLRQGSKGIALYESDMRRLGVTNQAGVDAANNLRMAQTRLKLSITGLAYSIAAQVAPALQPLLDWFTDLIARNREAIAARIGEAVKTFAVWIRGIDWQQIGDEIAEIFHNAQDVAQSLGGWKEVAKGVGGAIMELLVARMLLGLGMTLVKVVQITKALKDMAVAAGIAQAASGAAGAAGAGAAAGGAAGGAAKSGFFARTGRVLGGVGVMGLRIGGNILRASKWPVALWAGYEANEMGKAPLAHDDTIMRGKPLPDKIAAEGRAAAARYGLDPDRFLSLLRTEQGGYDTVSPAGAFGPGQLMPGTARQLGVADSVKAPGYSWQANIDASGRYQAQLLRRFHGNYEAMAAGYNAGPNNPGVQRFAQTGDFSALPSETQHYVASIDAETAVAKRQRQPSAPVQVQPPRLPEAGIAPPPPPPPQPTGSPTSSPPDAQPTPVQSAARPQTRSAADAGVDQSRLTISLEVQSKGEQPASVRVRDVRAQGSGPAPRVSTPMPTTG